MGGGVRYFTESTPLNPQSIYAAAKASIEHIANYYNHHYHTKIKSLRIGQAFGARTNVRNKFLKACQDSCIMRQPVKVFGTGKTSQDYVYVKDAALGIRLALEHAEVSGPFNIGSGRSTSTFELAEAFCEGFRNPSGAVLVPGQENIHYNCMDITHSQEVLGYSPKYSLKEACADMFSIYTAGNEPSC